MLICLSYESQLLPADVRPSTVHRSWLQNPVTGPTAFESFQNANPIWQALNTAFLTVVSNTTSVSSTTLYYYQQIYGPLFEMFQQFPNGIFKGPMASAPLTVTASAGEHFKPHCCSESWQMCCSAVPQ